MVGWLVGGDTPHHHRDVLTCVLHERQRRLDRGEVDGVLRGDAQGHGHGRRGVHDDSGGVRGEAEDEAVRAQEGAGVGHARTASDDAPDLVYMLVVVVVVVETMMVTHRTEEE